MLATHTHVTFLITVVCGDTIGRKGTSTDWLLHLHLSWPLRQSAYAWRHGTESRRQQSTDAAHLGQQGGRRHTWPDLTQAMKQLEGQIDDVKVKAQQEAGG